MMANVWRSPTQKRVRKAVPADCSFLFLLNDTIIMKESFYNIFSHFMKASTRTKEDNDIYFTLRTLEALREITRKLQHSGCHMNSPVSPWFLVQMKETSDEFFKKWKWHTQEGWNILSLFYIYKKFASQVKKTAGWDALALLHFSKRGVFPIRQGGNLVQKNPPPKAEILRIRINKDLFSFLKEWFFVPPALTCTWL